MKLSRSSYLPFALTLCLLASACGGKKEEHGQEEGAKAGSAASVRVVASPVQPQAFEDWGEFSADLRGSQDAVLTAAMGGRVAKVSEVGKLVRAGEALCDIESSRYEAMVLQAKSAFELSKGELERQKANVEKGYVGKAVLDKAELDFQSSRVALLQAQRAYEDSRCQAPFDGVLVSRFIEAYQTLPPGAPTVRVAATARLVAVIAIPENEAGGFKEGQAAEFSQAQDPATVFKGTVKAVDRAVEAHNRTVNARVEISNTGGVLKPGMVGRARILRKKYGNAVVIPSSAVMRLQEGTAVMVIRDGKAEKAPVRLGAASGESVVVLEGLSPGDILITMGGFQVTPGMPVTY